MRTLKTGEDIYLLKMEYILSPVVEWKRIRMVHSLYKQWSTHVLSSSICLRTLEGAYIQSII